MNYYWNWSFFLDQSPEGTGTYKDKFFGSPWSVRAQTFLSKILQH